MYERLFLKQYFFKLNSFTLIINVDFFFYGNENSDERYENIGLSHTIYMRGIHSI